MAETPPKRRAKPERGEQSVLGTLPASRPERIGRPRHAAAENGAVKPPRAKAKPRATANGAAAKPRATVNGAAPKRPAKRAPAKAAPALARTDGPEAVRPACEPLRVSRAADPPPHNPIGAPTGTELVTTTIRAAGELAQIGFTVGGQVLKRTIDRIPRP